MVLKSKQIQFAFGRSKRLYKIRRRRDGLFSNGFICWNHAKLSCCCSLRFVSQGNFWTNLAHLKSHMRRVFKSVSNPYGGCDVIEYSLTPLESKIEDVGSFLFMEDL